MTQGSDLIAAERESQIDDRGQDSGLDPAHDDGDLAFAAACLAAPTTIYLVRTFSAPDGDTGSARWVEPWPIGWERPARSQQRTHEERVEELTKAGALIAAELDRLLWLEEDRIRDLPTRSDADA